MRTVRWLVAAGLLGSATACVETNGYPGRSYGGYPSGYGGYPSSGYYGQPSGSGLFSSLFNQQPSYYQQPAYYQQPTYYQPPPQVVTQTRYVPVPTATSQRPYGSRSSWGSRDNDGDGIPNRYDRDRNNDGIPDRQQRRNRSG
ncbi:MAG TPA: hypothetical protein VFF19_29285 [Reyranella sp.]|nr:hypothetical protein [Reyranella sp.]